MIKVEKWRFNHNFNSRKLTNRRVFSLSNIIQSIDIITASSNFTY